MKTRLKHDASLNPEALKAMMDLGRAVEASNLPAATRYLVHLRASQINGCGLCLGFARHHARQPGESDERIFAVAGGVTRLTLPMPSAPRWR
ncbi:MAG: carboxymuconolactone decarboxylase family protein [Terriglobales bacterium]